MSRPREIARTLSRPLIAGSALLLTACGPTSGPPANQSDATRDAPAPTPVLATPPAPEAAPAPTAGTRHFTGPKGSVRLDYPADWTPGTDFAGHAMMTGGWRVRFTGTENVSGKGIVSFTRTARPSEGPGEVIEMLRIGASDAVAARTDCATAGLSTDFGSRLPDRTIGGRSWAAWRQSDVGMSQQADVLALRTLVGNTCYAVDRIGYAVKAKEPAHGLPAQAAVSADLDAILASLVIGSNGSPPGG
ncbi:hypothetical protein FSZ31_10920 [Sphingorhabdus soli]|uniref:Uncharacterized protein n=1 Tax=Flavisphingopyxis soli TaxID=2601267 RepID=A0A5C6U9H6_9SPHN|nr:hypothetical protein [Sphingorhabdus soli]TXC68198.1 hypothetical protein FSZ31_10920 [Sphingorhabdus soli]